MIDSIKKHPDLSAEQICRCQKSLNHFNRSHQSDFSSLQFGETHDAVVYAVRDGKVDAGTVRTDVLETMELEGSINLADFHIIHEDGYEDDAEEILLSFYPYDE